MPSPLYSILPGGTASSINIHVNDPLSFQVTFNSNNEYALPFAGVKFDFSPDGGTTFVNKTTSLGQLPITVSYSTGSGTATTPKFASYCVDLAQDLNNGTQTFAAAGIPAA